MASSSTPLPLLTKLGHCASSSLALVAMAVSGTFAFYDMWLVGMASMVVIVPTYILLMEAQAWIRSHESVAKECMEVSTFEQSDLVLFLSTRHSRAPVVKCFGDLCVFVPPFPSSPGSWSMILTFCITVAQWTIAGGIYALSLVFFG